MKIGIQITSDSGSHKLTATLVDNSSATAFYNILKKAPVTIKMSDYSNFEKYGPIGTSLPRNDTQITTTAGDIILYQGNQIAVYYDTNSWNFTRLGKVDGVTQAELKRILGKGDVTAVFSVMEQNEMLLKKIILILEALLMTAFVMAEEKPMKKNADTIRLNSGFNMRRTQERASRVFDKQKLADTIQLNSGFEMPVLGLGTWTLTGETCENAVYVALKSGYRLIDTAKYYGNEREVGNAIRRAIKDGICKREEIFVTTKLVPWSNNPDLDIDDSLKQLGLSYIDLCLLHQHGSDSGDDAVYKAMIRAAKDGKIRSIGISNFYTEKTVSHFINDFEIPPAVIQNENHLKYQNNSLRDWADKKGIYIESYYPFGGRGHTKEHLQNETVLEIARAHGKSAAQIIVRWHLQSGYITIPGSSNPAHIAENFDVWDFELTENEMKKLNALDTGRRYENW